MDNSGILKAFNDHFVDFLEDIQSFIFRESGENNHEEYRGKVKFIRDFKLLTTQDILNYENRVELMNFKLIEFGCKDDKQLNEALNILKGIDLHQKN